MKERIGPKGENVVERKSDNSGSEIWIEYNGIREDMADCENVDTTAISEGLDSSHRKFVQVNFST